MVLSAPEGFDPKLGVPYHWKCESSGSIHCCGDNDCSTENRKDFKQCAGLIAPSNCNSTQLDTMKQVAQTAKVAQDATTQKNKNWGNLYAGGCESGNCHMFTNSLFNTATAALNLGNSPSDFADFSNEIKADYIKDAYFRAGNESDKYYLDGKDGTFLTKCVQKSIPVCVNTNNGQKCRHYDMFKNISNTGGDLKASCDVPISVCSNGSSLLGGDYNAPYSKLLQQIDQTYPFVNVSGLVPRYNSNYSPTVERKDFENNTQPICEDRVFSDDGTPNLMIKSTGCGGSTLGNDICSGAWQGATTNTNVCDSYIQYLTKSSDFGAESINKVNDSNPLSTLTTNDGAAYGVAGCIQQGWGNSIPNTLPCCLGDLNDNLRCDPSWVPGYSTNTNSFLSNLNDSTKIGCSSVFHGGSTKEGGHYSVDNSGKNTDVCSGSTLDKTKCKNFCMGSDNPDANPVVPRWADSINWPQCQDWCDKNKTDCKTMKQNTCDILCTTNDDNECNPKCPTKCHCMYPQCNEDYVDWFSKLQISSTSGTDTVTPVNTADMKSFVPCWLPVCNETGYVLSNDQQNQRDNQCPSAIVSCTIGDTSVSICDNSSVINTNTCSNNFVNQVQQCGTPTQQQQDATQQQQDATQQQQDATQQQQDATQQQQDAGQTLSWQCQFDGLHCKDEEGTEKNYANCELVNQFPPTCDPTWPFSQISPYFSNMVFYIIVTVCSVLLILLIVIPIVVTKHRESKIR